MNTQPEALSLAEVFEEYAVDHQPDGWPAIRQETLNSAATELRRLHAENEALRSALYPSANQKIEVSMTSERQELEALFAIGEQSAAELAAQHKPVCTVIDEALSDGTTRVRLSPEFRGRLRHGTQLYAALEHPGVEPVTLYQVRLDVNGRWQDIAKDEMQDYPAKEFWETRTLYTAPQPAKQPEQEPVAEVESTVHGAGGFHCRLLAYSMPPVGAKLYTAQPDTDALLNENRVLRESLERCKKVGSATASCWDDDKKEADVLLRKSLEALSGVTDMTDKKLVPKAITAIRKYLGEE